MNEATIDCQGCGKVMRRLDESERREVAVRPYDFVWWCWDCRRQGLHVEEMKR